MTEPTQPTEGTTQTTDLRRAAVLAAQDRRKRDAERIRRQQAENRRAEADTLRRIAGQALDNYADALEITQDPNTRATHPGVPGVVFKTHGHATQGTQLMASHDNGQTWRVVSELADLGEVIRSQAHQRGADVLAAGDVEPYGEVI